MQELKLKQVQYESDTWKRLLVFLKEENVHLKNRLSDVLKNGFENNSLEDMEGFQTRFIKEDERLGLLWNEVVEVDQWLVREIVENGRVMKKVEKKIKKLRTKIMSAERQFRKLKQEFNNYLSEAI
jgi:Txe/YoeB family toxin of Txe-Axe toxin-antitoxin module